MKKTIIFTLFLYSGISWTAGQPVPRIGDYFELMSWCETTPVKSQDITGTCWSYSTTSFLESELLRLGRGEWDLSEMFVVRMIYLDKAEQYLRYQGKTNFSQGSLGHDLLRVYQMHGMMPESAYSGYNGKEKHNHTAMEKSMKLLLDSLIAGGTIERNWRDAINRIMDKEMGSLPETFEVNGKKYTARSFADEVLQLNPNDYVQFTSFTHQPLHQQVIVQVPDNYSRGEYCNVSLSEMMELMTFALQNGHSVEWDGDVSGGGFNPRAGVAVYTSDTSKFTSVSDKPENNPYSAAKRQEEFDAYITTDDHLMHITGLARGEDGVIYFVTKNSWGTGISFDGYVMMSNAYVAMRTVCIIVHRDAIPPLLTGVVNSTCSCHN